MKETEEPVTSGEQQWTSQADGLNYHFELVVLEVIVNRFRIKEICFLCVVPRGFHLTPYACRICSTMVDLLLALRLCDLFSRVLHEEFGTRNQEAKDPKF